MRPVVELLADDDAHNGFGRDDSIVARRVSRIESLEAELQCVGG
jgi:hypothetical protein